MSLIFVPDIEYENTYNNKNFSIYCMLLYPDNRNIIDYNIICEVKPVFLSTILNSFLVLAVVDEYC